MTIDELLTRFEDVSETADGYLMRCPAHTDSRPSLRLWIGDNAQARLHCRAGCKTEDVVRSAGLEWRNLFDVTGDAVTVPKERPAAVGTAHVAGLRVWLDSLPVGDGSYVEDRFGIDTNTAASLGLRYWAPSDEHPEFVARSFARFPRVVVPLNGFDGVTRGAQGRDISGECPGRWLSLTNPEGHRWASYGVFRAGGHSGATLVCEGPGDALTAVGAGFDAVAVRGAALAASPELIAELAEGLRGQRVVVAGDNDSAGQAFNQRLAQGLAAHGVEVCALALPDGVGDLSDWFASLRTAFAEVLHEAVEAAMPLSASAADVAPAEIDDVEWKGQLRPSLTRDSDTKLVPHVNYASLVRRVAGDVLMNVRGVGWYTWDGRRWRAGADNEAAYAALTDTANALAQREGSDEAQSVLLNSQHRRYIVEELGRLPEVQVEPDDIEPHRHLLNFQNGTVDLRDGSLRPHDPADRITHVANVDYVPSARSPRWDQFLDEIFPGEPELQAYYQRFLGMGISGETRDHKLGVWYGSHGRNGKGATIRTLKAAFGTELVADKFMAPIENIRDGSNPEQLQAQLFSARLVFFQEGTPDAPIKTALLKAWSGGDSVDARRLYSMPFTYTPRFNVVLATNNLPQFNTGGEALWARTQALLFGQSFAGREDPELEPTVQGPEAEGVAAWVVRGAMDYYANGLQAPQAVLAAVEWHKAEVDPIRQLVGEVFEYAEGRETIRADFNRALKEWRDENGDRSGKYAPSTVKRALMQQGVEETRNARGKWCYRGIALCSEMDNAPAGPGIFDRTEG
jgi:putative DNA primase/helicase